MKSLRVWLLLLLIALVPLRGSLAAALVLDGEMAGCRPEAGEHMHDAGPGASLQHDHAPASALEKHHGQPAAPDKCNLCSGLTTPACPLESVAALEPARATLKVPPQQTPWPPSFVSAALERPPRNA